MFSGGIRAETPLSPVHLTATRLESGDIGIGWIRRGRIEADGWTAGDVALDEPVEAYRLEILDGPAMAAAVRRQLEVAAPRWTYPQLAESADFGGRQSALALRVAQIGRLSAGIAAEATVRIR
ncbi:gene transfer agent (GTA) protein [Rhizobium sp. PDO1-076]|nr:gene transfer agent (GTA) protein [Rhizobium sp. PDO1-076]